MNRKQKAKVIRIAVGLFLFACAFLPVDFPYYRPLVFGAAMLSAGGDVFWKAIRNLLKGQVLDEDFLMSLAATGAFFVKEYPEGVIVMLMSQLGWLFENMAVSRSRRAVAELMKLRPETATVLRNGELVTVDPETVEVGETVVIAPGQRIPLDGTVRKGESSLDTSMLTGESLPREIYPGDEALSGCVNLTGRVEINVTKPFGESIASKILTLVEDASAKKAGAERFITKFARVYTPAVVVCAVLLAAIPPLFFGGAFQDWLHRALTFLVVSCPCALVISVPLSFFGGIGGASRKGILIKGGVCLETLARAQAVALDKTGTLTEGAFTVTHIRAAQKGQEDALLYYAAYAESASSHPIARSIVEAYQKPVDDQRVTEIKEHAGFGVSANVDGKRVWAGSIRFLSREGIAVPEDEAEGTRVHVAVDKAYLGCVALADKPKPGAREAVSELNELGVGKVVMLTGDSLSSAAHVASVIGIREIRAELLPDGKVREMEKLAGDLPDKGSLVFAGDGINDAPVIAMADVGVAMGGMGSDAAIEAADVVIMDDNILKLPKAVRIARKTMRIVRQNIVFSLTVKLAALVLGALGVTGMWEAVFADVGVSVIAIINAMRTLRE